MKQQLGFSILFITHDLSLMVEFSDRIAIMYAGQIVELAAAQEMFNNPLHPYTQGLMNSFPPLTAPKRRLTGIPGSPPNMVDPPSGCRFHPRCTIVQTDGDRGGPAAARGPAGPLAALARRACPYPQERLKHGTKWTEWKGTIMTTQTLPPGAVKPSAGHDNEVVLEVRNLTKHFPVGTPFRPRHVHALNDVSFTIARRQVVALVGELGSGKSTTARLIARLMPPTRGEILLHGKDVLKTEPRRRSLAYRKAVQMIFRIPSARSIR